MKPSGSPSNCPSPHDVQTAAAARCVSRLRLRLHLVGTEQTDQHFMMRSGALHPLVKSPVYQQEGFHAQLKGHLLHFFLSYNPAIASSHHLTSHKHPNTGSKTCLFLSWRGAPERTSKRLTGHAMHYGIVSNLKAG